MSDQVSTRLLPELPIHQGLWAGPTECGGGNVGPGDGGGMCLKINERGHSDSQSTVAAVLSGHDSPSVLLAFRQSLWGECISLPTGLKGKHLLSVLLSLVLKELCILKLLKTNARGQHGPPPTVFKDCRPPPFASAPSQM